VACTVKKISKNNSKPRLANERNNYFHDTSRYNRYRNIDASRASSLCSATLLPYPFSLLDLGQRLCVLLFRVVCRFRDLVIDNVAGSLIALARSNFSAKDWGFFFFLFLL
jgi:hypothetical protein